MHDIPLAVGYMDVRLVRLVTMYIDLVRYSLERNLSYMSLGAVIFSARSPSLYLSTHSGLVVPH